MLDKDKFYRELGDYLGVPSDVVITLVEEDANYREGCPTCGGDYEYSMFVLGNYPDGTRYCKVFDGRLSDFIASL